MMSALDAVRRQAAIQELLDQAWVSKVEWRVETVSTNDDARAWAEAEAVRSGSIAPALFLADRQTAGRGRGAHRWWSPEGCLMLTLVVPHGQMPADRTTHAQLALVIGLAISKTVDQVLGKSVARLKWPNDVYVDTCKVAGTLIESLPEGWAVGVGLNACMDWSLAPDEIRNRATCLSRVAQCAIERESVLVELIPQIQLQLAKWNQDTSSWWSEWSSRCLLSGRDIAVQTPLERISGRCEGVDSNGRLNVRSFSGLQSIIAGEVLHW